MSNVDIIRAWKDAEYRASLSPEQLAKLPQNPAGTNILRDAEVNEQDLEVAGIRTFCTRCTASPVGYVS